jgi:hypothetical protein
MWGEPGFSVEELPSATFRESVVYHVPLASQATPPTPRLFKSRLDSSIWSDLTVSRGRENACELFQSIGNLFYVARIAANVLLCLI